MGNNDRDGGGQGRQAFQQLDPDLVRAGREMKGTYRPWAPPTAGIVLAQEPPEELLRNLSNMNGLWHDLANSIPNLYRSGYTPASVEEETGISGTEQNTMYTASQVYLTLKGPELTDAERAWFDPLWGSGVLYELRMLNANERRKAGKYLAQMGVSDVLEARKVARALKDAVSRLKDMQRLGFAPSTGGLNEVSMGDAIAYSSYRIAQQERAYTNEHTIALRNALAAVESPAARDVITKEMVPPSAEELARERRMPNELQVTRLEADELGTRACMPVPLVGDVAMLRGITSLMGAPKVDLLDTLGTGYGLFRVPRDNGADFSYVPLPRWMSLDRAALPVALSIPYELMPGTERHARESKEKLLLLVDAIQPGTATEGPEDLAQWYLVNAGEGGMGVVGEWSIKALEDVAPSETVCAIVISAVRPASDDML